MWMVGNTLSAIKFHLNIEAFYILFFIAIYEVEQFGVCAGEIVEMYVKVKPNVLLVVNIRIEVSKPYLKHQDCGVYLVVDIIIILLLIHNLKYLDKLQLIYCKQAKLLI